MPSTDPRSRDEWLAEIMRRGERLRHRRRLAAGVVGALALALPVSVVASLLGDAQERTVAVSVAGPAPAGDNPTTAGAAPGQVGYSGPAAPVANAVGTAEPGAAGGLSPTTTVELHQRVAVINGSTTPQPPPSVPPADDPVVRPPTTTATNGGDSSSVAGGAISSTTIPPVSASPAPACPAADVRVTVAAEKATYVPGETVRATSTLENRAAGPCLLPTRAFFRVNDAGGRSVGSFAYTTEFRMPVVAEPGRSFTSTVSWDQRDCSGMTCVPVPSGTYTFIADWTESGPYSGRATFQIAG